MTEVDDDVIGFCARYLLATLTTLRPDGSPHVAPVGFTLDADAGLVRVITFASAQRVRNLRAAAPGSTAARASVCQVEGQYWLTFEGPAEVIDDPERVAEAVRRYALRYRQPGERDDRVVIEIRFDRVMGRAAPLATPAG